MRREDATEFQALLDRTCSLLSRGSYVPDPENSAMFFRALARHDLADVRRAFEAHIADPQRGRFVPTPADILAQLTGAAANDGRPGAEEAWALCMRGANEADTIVWTAEMAEAWGVCKPVLDAGDDVGARMAFRETYTRIVQAARDTCTPAQWTVTLGYDEARRESAIREAVSKGRLQAADVGHLVPALAAPADTPLLDGPRIGRVQRRAEAVEKLQSLSSHEREPLSWARDLKAREEAGEPLSDVQRKSWRAALESPLAAGIAQLGEFNPVPPEALPPGMRGEA